MMEDFAPTMEEIYDTNEAIEQDKIKQELAELCDIALCLDKNATDYINRLRDLLYELVRDKLTEGLRDELNEFSIDFIFNSNRLFDFVEKINNNEKEKTYNKKL